MEEEDDVREPEPKPKDEALLPLAPTLQVRPLSTDLEQSIEAKYGGGPHPQPHTEVGHTWPPPAIFIPPPLFSGEVGG